MVSICLHREIDKKGERKQERERERERERDWERKEKEMGEGVNLCKIL